jgi:hypothetical protein
MLLFSSPSILLCLDFDVAATVHCTRNRNQGNKGNKQGAQQASFHKSETEER